MLGYNLQGYHMYTSCNDITSLDTEQIIHIVWAVLHAKDFPIIYKSQYNVKYSVHGLV